jgi:hypothetical protein
MNESILNYYEEPALRVIKLTTLFAYESLVKLKDVKLIKNIFIELGIYRSNETS